jgi:acyl-CoA reductase-like NAD-dependent aldehyde dehydrogenase
MPTRLEIIKTYKLFIGGKFPRTESGRSLKIESAGGKVLAHICHGSRKDLRDAVEAAAKAQPGWAGATAYNRGQVLYRMAEMMEGKREEFAEAINETSTASRLAATRRGALREVDAAIDRLVCFGGWADKFAQVLGCNNPVAGPHYNFTIPEAMGVVGVVAPDEPPLLGLIALMAPPLCAGNSIVAVGSDLHPLPAAILGEVCATSDVPPGVVNIITGRRGELLEHLANHREVAGIHTANLPRAETTALKLGAAENIKRVTAHALRQDDWYDADICDSPWMIEPFVDMKTVWHPSST